MDDNRDEALLLEVPSAFVADEDLTADQTVLVVPTLRSGAVPDAVGLAVDLVTLGAGTVTIAVYHEEALAIIRRLLVWRRRRADEDVTPPALELSYNGEKVRLHLQSEDPADEVLGAIRHLVEAAVEPTGGRDGPDIADGGSSLP